MRRTGPEKRFWKRVRIAWSGHMARVEASMGGCDPGTPDTSLGWGGRNMWVELKVWPDPLSAEQIVWHTDCAQRGGGCVVLCELPLNQVWLGDYATYQQCIKEKIAPHGVPLDRELAYLMRLLADSSD